MPALGVAHDGGVRRFCFLALLALGSTLPAHQLEVLLDPVDALAGQAAVNLNLLFPHPPGRSRAPGTPASLSIKVPPHAGHTGKRILHAGQFNLQSSLLGLRPPGKDIENNFLPVDYRHIRSLFPLALLVGSQFIVKDDTIAPQFPGMRQHFLRLACSTKKLLVPFTGPHQLGAHYPDPKRSDKLTQFRKQTMRFLFLALVETNAHEEGLLDHLRSVAHLKHGRDMIRPWAHCSRQKEG